MNWRGVEKRRFVRVKVPCKITVYSPQEHAIHTQTKNIGGGGLGVVIDEKLEPESIVSLNFFLDEKSITCRARVVWVLQRPDLGRNGESACDSGFEFYDISQDARKQVSVFVDKLIEKSNDY